MQSFYRSWREEVTTMNKSLTKKSLGCTWDCTEMLNWAFTWQQQRIGSWLNMLQLTDANANCTEKYHLCLGTQPIECVMSVLWRRASQVWFTYSNSIAIPYSHRIPCHEEWNVSILPSFPEGGMSMHSPTCCCQPVLCKVIWGREHTLKGRIQPALQDLGWDSEPLEQSLKSTTVLATVAQKMSIFRSTAALCFCNSVRHIP